MNLPNMFGIKKLESVFQKKTMTFNVADKSVRDELERRTNYQNKDYFWNAVKPIVDFLEKEKYSVDWTGGSPMAREKAKDATQIIFQKKYAATKPVIVSFYTFLFGDYGNVLTVVSKMMTPKGEEIAKKIVNEGALSLVELATMMSWPPYKRSYWSSEDSETYHRWTTSKDTAPVHLLSSGISGAATGRYGYSDPYIIPEPELIIYVHDKENKPLDVSEIANPADEGLTLFSGEDLFGNESTIQDLILSQTIEPGQKKVGANAIKKLNSYVPLEQFPSKYDVVFSRSAYVAMASFSAFGFPYNFNLASEPYSDNDFRLKLFSFIQCKTKDFVLTILSDRVKGLSQDFYYYKEDDIQRLFDAVASTLIKACREIDGGWTEIKSFQWHAEYELAMSDCGYIYPDSNALNPSSARDSVGNPMPPTKFKECIHGVLFYAMVEGLAAIGGADLLFDKAGRITHVRLNQAGKWYLGISKEEPKSKPKPGLAEAISVDDMTGFITVKNPDFAYVSLLPEFAAKLSDNKYALTEKTFLKKCNTPSDLDAKINRFKTFVLPEPGPKIQAMLDNMQRNCNLVKKSTGGSTYQLYDIDPKNTRLHSLLISNKEIVKNTLRVEGCRLLIKTKFLPKFTEILNDNGFLNSLS